MSGERHRTDGASAVRSGVRWSVGVLGAAALIGSVLALTVPVSLYAVDRSGQPVSCGTVLSPAYETAAREDAVNRRLHETRGALFQPTSYAHDCAALVSQRRSVGFPAAALGALAVLAVGAFALRRSVRPLVQVRRADAPAESPAAPARDVVEEAVSALNRKGPQPPAPHTA